jgi:ammonium transporter, Amt family
MEPISSLSMTALRCDSTVLADRVRRPAISLVDRPSGLGRRPGIWGVHGVGGALGTIMLGIIGTTSVNAAGANGLFFGGTDFFVKQVTAVVASSIDAFGFTWGMLWLIDRVTPVTTTEQMEQTLDESLHGEQAYLA